MMHVEWMCRDERSPEQIRRDRLRSLDHEEAELMRRLARVQEERAAITAGQRSEIGK